MTATIIREFRYDDADYQARIDIMHEMDPDYLSTAEDVRASDDTYPKQYPRHVWMVEAQGVPIGMLTIRQHHFSYHPQKWQVLFAVRPPLATDALFEQVMDFAEAWLSDKPVIAIQSATRANHEAWLAFLQAKGFSVIMRDYISQLVVQDFDATPYAEREASVRAGGIEIIDAVVLSQRRDDWLRVLWELDMTIDMDIPSTDESQVLTFDEYKPLVESNAMLDKKHWLVALDAEQAVGMTLSVPTSKDPAFFETYSTGVLRSHRRRGIALALKVEGIRRIQAAGGRIIDTGNEENNPMYQINQRLGFKARPAWLRLEKPLSESISINGRQE